MEGSAIFDVSRRYRYCLKRSWSGPNIHPHQVTFIMLNPSQANAERDDPTIRACSQFAQAWGYNQLNIVNLFAYRTPQPSALKRVADPIGPDNDQYLLQAIEAATQVILAWGNWGTLFNRAQTVLTLLQPQHHKLHCLARNQSGQPRHPLYIKRTTSPKPWS
ncbi:DUF1643 domain-containing protein [Leptothoe sp. PORK10 BA2]|uniref:DUF1643 domain-containing protein n=1 Tax=Leptothoe sp. PORK10 BA2 TaxID=3110254 RepID=UPI002B20AC2D|nr:DUF1643 domain-containing protein [Leptothoe sp. PORK10 BA2]MEA5463870.1 DUF1643 domain-containing protein [Leptothoe sp. PORK10 BA2]